MKVVLESLFYSHPITLLKFCRKLLKNIVVQVIVQKFGVTLKAKSGNIFDYVSVIFRPVSVLYKYIHTKLVPFVTFQMLPREIKFDKNDRDINKTIYRFLL